MTIKPLLPCYNADLQDLTNMLTDGVNTQGTESSTDKQNYC